jgi:putative acyl-CoA dehydrogenase
MKAVLADLAIESEAATTLGLRLASAVDDGDTAFGRLAVALGKYWVCKRTIPVVAEALECLGGNGYIEENGLARLYREAPLNSIWEGSGNVNALDVLRALDRSPAAIDAVLAELDLARGADRRLDAAISSRVGELRAHERFDDSDRQAAARRLVERLATVLQASLLVRFAPPAVADAYVATRGEHEGGFTFGTMPSGQDVDAILARALP